MWKFVLCVLLYLSSIPLWASEDSSDTYDYKSSCPASPNWTEPNTKFAACNCTSYVANKLNQRWSQSPKFVNTAYYTKTDSERWGDARFWQKKSVCVGIGVTKASDNFPWELDRFNAVFNGDVAWWDKWNENEGKYGHVAFVESATKGHGDRGVQCVTVSEYNYNPPFDFRRRDICKGDGQRFPDYFLHIDQDHIYCLQNPSLCPGFLSGDPKTCSIRSGGNKGGGSDPFNLIINDFWVKDTARSLDLVPGADTVQTGEALEVRIQVKAKDGDTHDHMRDGRDTIEVDVYAREDVGEWYFLQREYIQATNLPSGATHTEHVAYTVPPGVSEVSFKAKIDAEDEAAESNEGDNWTEIQTFQVSNTPFYDLIITSLSLTTSSPAAPGSPMGARFSIRNIGNITPPMNTRGCYDIFGPGTNGLWQNIASDQSDGGTLVPGFDRWEEIHTLVPAPTVPGMYSLRVMANCTNGVPESDVSNNGYTIPFEVRSIPPKLVITRFQDESGCCTTNLGSRIKPDIWVRNDGPVAPGANVPVVYHISSPVATGGAYISIGSGSIRPDELPPGGTDEDYMDNAWSIPKNSTWKNQWHTVRGCLKVDGSTPVGDPSTEVCAYYTRYSKK